MVSPPRCLCLLCVSLIRTFVIGLKNHLHNPGWSPHLKILHLIKSTKAFLFQIGSRLMYLFFEGAGGTIHYTSVKKLSGNVSEKYTTVFEGSHWGLKGRWFCCFESSKKLYSTAVTVTITIPCELPWQLSKESKLLKWKVSPNDV